MIDALVRSLQGCPKGFDGLCMRIAIHVLPNTVICILVSVHGKLLV